MLSIFLWSTETTIGPNFTDSKMRVNFWYAVISVFRSTLPLSWEIYLAVSVLLHQRYLILQYQILYNVGPCLHAECCWQVVQKDHDLQPTWMCQQNPQRWHGCAGWIRLLPFRGELAWLHLCRSSAALPWGAAIPYCRRNTRKWKQIF